MALQQARVDAQKHSVEALRAEPDARERIAREQLGYARPGEVTFVLPEEAPAGEGGGPDGGTAVEEADSNLNMSKRRSEA